MVCAPKVAICMKTTMAAMKSVLSMSIHILDRSTVAMRKWSIISTRLATEASSKASTSGWVPPPADAPALARPAGRLAPGSQPRSSPHHYPEKPNTDADVNRIDRNQTHPILKLHVTAARSVAPSTPSRANTGRHATAFLWPPLRPMPFAQLPPQCLEAGGRLGNPSRQHDRRRLHPR